MGKLYIHKQPLRSVLLVFSFLVILATGVSGQPAGHRLYPYIYDTCPDIISPSDINDTTEIIIVINKYGKYGIMPVTMENGKPLVYSYKIGTFIGKDQQLSVDGGDFPSLARTGLHSEEQLKKKEMVTGFPVSVINCTGKPDGYSISGFMAKDEDLISVLIGDKRMVANLGLTHPQMAKPLFHIWNLILLESELGNWGRFYDNIKQIKYNNNLLNLEASGSKGWQPSIFLDEIQGRYNIHIDRRFTPEEENYLMSKYSHLTSDEMLWLQHKLSVLDFGEMLPYYIMRYGFYEGHVDYRCDPLAISFIFGLLSLEEIDGSVGGKLYDALMDHFTAGEMLGDQGN